MIMILILTISAIATAIAIVGIFATPRGSPNILDTAIEGLQAPRPFQPSNELQIDSRTRVEVEEANYQIFTGAYSYP